jgi:putative tryptophan/tyrosine transport system substrate-binding protein
MKKIIGLILIGLIGLLFHYSSTYTSGRKIGIIVPIEHQAMKEITDGFIKEIRKKYDQEVVVDIQNAQGDRHIQKAIIENFKRKNYELIVPIGTDVTLMTQNIIKEQSILALDVTTLITQEQSNVTGIRESPINPSYAFIKQLIPHLKKITMVYSGSDKNYEMMKSFKELASLDEVIVQPIMIQSLADLYVLGQIIDRDSNAIFIAKDHLVANGAPTLVQAASRLKIPLITSDNGSVIAGGTIAMGNKEFDIGSAGGLIAIQLLEGKKTNEIPILPLSTYTVFVNAEAINNISLDIEEIQKIAHSFNYPIEFVQENSKS